MFRDMGCGKDIRSGYVNIDTRKLKGVDKVLNLSEKLPYESEIKEVMGQYGIVQKFRYLPNGNMVVEGTRL